MLWVEKRRILRLLCAPGLLMLVGCGDMSPSEANALFGTSATVKAASQLKEYAVAQNIFRNQSDGRFGTLKELIAEGMLSKQFARATTIYKNPVPVNGYLFAEITEDSNSKPLQRHAKAGLCAFAANGSNNSSVILMLFDVNDPEEYAFYYADGAKVHGPITRWPSAADLEQKFTRKRQRSPEEAEKEAGELVDKMNPLK